MTTSRVKQQWDHTSEILSLMANCWCRGKGDPPFRGYQFHPLRQRKQREPNTKEAFALLKEAFVNGRISSPGRR